MKQTDRALFVAAALGGAFLLAMAQAPIGDQTWNAFTFGYIGIFLILKAVLIGKRTAVGRSLALTNLSIGVSYAWVAAISIWPDSWLDAHWLLWMLRAAICLTVTWSAVLLLRIWWSDCGHNVLRRALRRSISICKGER
jgi:hypothetical protein